MDDFKVIARLLAAIKAGEDDPPFDVALVSPKALKTTELKRDRLALKLQKAGYIDGLFVVDDIDNLPEPVVLWDSSSPSITLDGLEYIATNTTLRKAGAEIKAFAADVAAKAVSNSLNCMF